MRKNIITSKISLKLLITTLFCLLLSAVSSLIPLYLLYRYIKNNRANLNINICNALSILVYVVVIGTFVTSFLLIINRKIKYIKYVAERVKKMSTEDLGSTVDIRGKDEIAELCTSINSMSLQLKERLEKEKEIENSKNELITNVSHDLRTPLTSIVGYVDLLRRKEYKNEEQLTEYIDTIHHKSQNLQNLINELFEYTKLSSPGIRITRSKVDLSSLLEQLVGEYVPIFAEAGLNIKREIPEQDMEVNVDVEKMVRVYENILTNAKKYSIKPSDIHVRLYTKDDKAIASISNRTDEIPVENLDELFEKFYRADSSRRNNDGSGLGLAIAKRIVELHDGKIWSEYSEGVITFFVELSM